MCDNDYKDTFLFLLLLPLLNGVFVFDNQTLYNMDIMRQSSRLIINPIYSYVFLFNCTTVGQASDSMIDDHDVKL